MVLGIIGRKLGMTQIFQDDGTLIPVTVVEAGPCPIIQKKIKEKDGYNALQLGFMKKKESKTNKPLLGHFKKAGKGAYYYLKEFRVDNVDDFEVGKEITIDIFKPGDYVDVTGTSKGRGFTGVMKRYGFKGAKASHGTHEYFRHGGSIGAAAYPAHVFKGQKMPGHMGNAKVTVLNLKVIDVRPEKNLIIVKGAIPGHINGIVTLTPTSRKKRATAKG